MTNQTPDWPRCGVVEPAPELDAAGWARFFDRSAGLLGILDQAGVIRRVNASLADAVGDPATALVGRAFLTLLDPADQDAAKRRLDRIGDDGRAGFDARLAPRSPTGTEHWVEWLVLEDPSAGLMFLSGREVTAEKQLAARLSVSEARQAYLLRLSDAMRALESADEVLQTATRMLAEQLRLNRALYAEV
ncbi:MAG TPA: PAS domain-containing protein, partial [Thermomicrobiaceae bacterium]|nr:PAS domain-containing protein [Thermomicrobiaceae bacterium]